MSKVYIEGMKMPKCCNECCLCAYADMASEFYCSAIAGTKLVVKGDSVEDYYYKGIKPDYCPLREANDDKAK